MIRSAVVFALTNVLLLLGGCGSPPVEYDIVIANGRVMDPESGLDAIANVGIRADKIVALGEQPMRGTVEIDAAGRVVAPGFIDLHRHGHSAANYQAQIHDGITTALELEIGVGDPVAWYAEREGSALVNYGATIGHLYARQFVATGEEIGTGGKDLLDPLTPQQVEQTAERVDAALQAGAVGVGFGLAYTPGADFGEVLEMFKVAAKRRAACFVHIRTNHTDFSNLDEVLELAEQSGASLHVVHINSSARDRVEAYLERIAEAQREGIDVTTECYPYNRGSTFIESRLFDDWETYSDEFLAGHTWVLSGESLTRETFGKYRAQGGILISPASYSEESVTAAVTSPLTMIASDGMRLVEGRAHPRTFGTYARILGRYVRERGELSLMDALRKMTLEPARRLQPRVTMMASKGRLKVGADADIVVFDPATVIDRATWEDSAQYSAGFSHVLVNGVVTLQDGELVAGAAAGRAVRAPN